MARDSELRAAMQMAADVLGSEAAHGFAGVETAERRYHPTAPGECAVRVQFEDGSVMWLVAEED